ncbi:hypothetical protein [Stenomitos frigidus]|uniref:hypothetical protein n=1 Tax=Stenomitos frigidus TaxID=1886765 RepID=UPI0011B2797E
MINYTSALKRESNHSESFSLNVVCGLKATGNANIFVSASSRCTSSIFNCLGLRKSSQKISGTGLLLRGAINHDTLTASPRAVKPVEAEQHQAKQERERSLE